MVCFSHDVSCTIVGDGLIGKTCMAKAFAGDSFPDYYVATVAESYTGYVSAYGDLYSVNIKDTNGQHEDENTRSQMISDADVIIICYSVVERETFNNVQSFWIQEIRKFNKRRPVILVATQSDIRDEDNIQHVSDLEGQHMTKLIGAEYYNKCSAAAQTGMKNVLESVVLASIKYRKKTASILKRVFGR
ncbi:RAC1 [Mytilus coruscus]|uniref:RAC1 n=1 Tax=Mytilus coruscus TaxID=42192 RepID=A0A6J7ZYI4_MYTCO|nr:RAC1 [Mytilus coruscus]